MDVGGIEIEESAEVVVVLEGVENEESVEVVQGAEIEKSVEVLEGLTRLLVDVVAWILWLFLFHFSFLFYLQLTVPGFGT